MVFTIEYMSYLGYLPFTFLDMFLSLFFHAACHGTSIKHISGAFVPSVLWLGITYREFWKTEIKRRERTKHLFSKILTHNVAWGQLSPSSSHLEVTYSMQFSHVLSSHNFSLVS